MIGKGRHVTGQERAELTALLVRWYRGGASIRQIAERTGRSYQTVRNMLTEAGTPLRPRGGYRYPPPDSTAPMHPDTTYARALGLELQRLRQSKGWTRARMCRDLTISVQTLATYENGTRSVAATRLAELCTLLGTQPHTLLAEVDRATLPNPDVVTVDLNRLARTDAARLTPAKRWAVAQLGSRTPDQPPLASLDGTALAHLGELCGLTPSELTTALHTL